MAELYVVGLGPGAAGALTADARAALDKAELLCGYTKYIDLIRPLWPAKPTLATGMMHELDRCRAALAAAQSGRVTALVCSGDAGVYGMASPVLELAAEYPGADVAVVPGVTAALGGAAVLGAPLGHDFCVVSLSDLLTPWAVIEKRLRAAAAGDFCLCLYNPASHRRTGHLRRACEILLAAGKAPDTACGWVKNIGRDGQCAKLTTLAALPNEPVDMFTTVFVGNAATRAENGRLVTPRGYRECAGS